MALDRARLENWRFLISTSGYASIVPGTGAAVHGVLWLLTPRDLAALNAYESLESGLYRRRILPVRRVGRLEPALVQMMLRHRHYNRERLSLRKR